MATNVKASTLIDFTGQALVEPIQIVVDPSSPETNEQHCFLVYTSTEPTLVSPVAGTISGTLQASTPLTEFINMSNSNAIASEFPVGSVISVNAVSEITQDKAIIFSPGDPIPVSTVLNTTTVDAGNITGQINFQYNWVNQWKFIHPGYSTPGPRTVCFTSPAQPTDVPVTYTIQGATGALADNRKVIIRARDFCTDVPIVGATVTLDGIVVGVTDALGEFNAGVLTGGTHSIKLSSATGFTDTDLDPLVNDSFTVTAA